MTSYVYSNFKRGAENRAQYRWVKPGEKPRLSTEKTGANPAHWDWSWLVSLALGVGSSAVVFRLF